MHMLCLQCGRLSVPDTRWAGSDLAEFLAWSLWSGAAWLYCFWRHLGREKSCARCGSQELMRESRATSHRWRAARPPLFFAEADLEVDRQGRQRGRPLGVQLMGKLEAVEGVEG